MKHRIKRFLAIFLSASIFMSNFFILDSRVALANGANLPGSGSFEGTLSDVFCVVVPTESAPVNGSTQGESLFNFILDPRRLAQNGTGTLSGKKLEPGATVYFQNTEPGAAYEYSSTSDPYTVINKSTIDIDVKLAAEIQSVDGVKLTTDKEFKNDSSASVYLALKDNDKTAALDRYGSVLRTVLQGCPDAYKVIYDFDLRKYRYDLKDGFTKFPQYDFRMTGACNSANTWSQIAQDFNASVVVTWSVAARPKNVSPVIEKCQYAMETGRPVLIEVDLGSGTLAATGIQSITYKNSGTTISVPSEYYLFENGTLRLKAALINSVIKEGVGSRTFTVCFNDKQKTTADVTLETEDMSPSISVTEYTMASGKPVVVEMDMGSGTLKATGVSQVTFVDAAGKSAVLDESNYTYGDGKLTLKASYIDKVLNNGRTERDLTVVFNDKAKTTVPLVLKTDGTLPSTAQEEFTMVRDQDVEVAVDLGAGALAATGIKQVTFTDASGGTVTLDAGNYTYENGKLTLKASYINKVLNNGRTTRDITIVFDNVVSTKKTIMLKASDEAPHIAEGEYHMVPDTPVLVPITLGSGASGATGIKEITFINPSGVRATLGTDKYKYDDEGNLRFFKAYINQLYTNKIMSREFTVILNDKGNTQGKVVLKIDGTGPSIAQTEYGMSKDTAVQVNLDLGSGELAATGIKSVTFKSASGDTTTLGSDKYSYANGVLTIKEAYINQMLNNGRATRDLTVTFNDPMATQQTIMLKVSGNAPSVTGASNYKMTSGSPVVVSLDLGTEGMKATGIKYITYKNAAGTTISVTTDKYKFENGQIKFLASYINQMLNNKVTSREFTITFNNAVQTEVKITLKK